MTTPDRTRGVQGRQTESHPGEGRRVGRHHVLMNAEAACMAHPLAFGPATGGATVTVAGNDPLAMALAELALPEARRLWVNLRRTTEIGALARALPDVDAIVLACRTSSQSEALSIMSTILEFLPVLRRNGGGEILLCAPCGPAMRGLKTFARGLDTTLSGQALRILTREIAPAPSGLRLSA